jgi:hypothetical protein
MHSFVRNFLCVLLTDLIRVFSSSLADLVFMLVYTMSTSRGLNDSDTYYLGGKLKRILVDRPLSSDGPPKAAKTFKTIRRVEEFHKWLQGPFVDAIFSGKTLDGG